MKYDDFYNYRHVLLRRVADKFLKLVDRLFLQTIKDMTVFHFTNIYGSSYMYGSMAINYTMIISSLTDRREKYVNEDK